MHGIGAPRTLMHGSVPLHAGMADQALPAAEGEPGEVQQVRVC